MTYPKPALVLLTDGELARLAEWAGDPSAGPLAVRARIVLACAAGPPGRPVGRPVSSVAAELGLSRDTVRKWRSRFLAMRLAGLRDAPRPGAPGTITDEQVAGVIARLLLEAPPAGQTALFNSWEDAVECSKCGGRMVRTGSCYTCRDCGQNTGCS